MLIYLVRHGETQWNKERRMQGSVDVPLNEFGIRLAEITAEGMKDLLIDEIISSPLNRAVTTAEILRGDRELPIRTDRRLHEMDFGDLEGGYFREAIKDESNPIYLFVRKPAEYVPVGGETFAQVIDRCREFIREELVPLEGKRQAVLLTAHGGLIRCFMRCIEDRPIENFWTDPEQYNCSVNILEMKDGVLSILEEGKLYYDYFKETGKQPRVKK